MLMPEDALQSLIKKETKVQQSHLGFFSCIYSSMVIALPWGI